MKEISYDEMRKRTNDQFDKLNEEINELDKQIIDLKKKIGDLETRREYVMRNHDALWQMRDIAFDLVFGE